MVKREMKFADECLAKHGILQGYGDDFFRNDMKNIMFEHVTGVLDRYNKYLLKNGYADMYAAPESEFDEWLKENL